MRSFTKSMLIPFFAMVFSALAFQACGEPPTTGSCVPNSTQACVCRTGGMGVQTCLPNGTYEACGNCDVTGGAGGAGGMSSSSSGMGGMDAGNCHDLPNTPVTCGNGTLEGDEECDDGNCEATDTCNNNCKKPYCGDGVIQPSNGETCEGEVDCSGCGIVDAGMPDVIDAGMCDGQEVFVGLLPAQNGAFSGGGQFGIDAANALCMGIGGNQMCDYVQWKQLETTPGMYPLSIMNLLAAIPNGTCTKIWLQRTTAVGANMPGPGGRCNNWNYPTDHIADGEFIEVCNMAGTLTYAYTLDPDTIFDVNNNGPHQNPGIPCSPLRPIPCCYKTCIP